MEHQYKDLSFEMPDNNNNNNNNDEKLPIELFQIINTELSDVLLHNSIEEIDDETDGPIDFIQKIVDHVKKDFENVVESNKRKTFLRVLTKVFATLLSVKTDNFEKIINLINISISSVIKS